MLVVVRLHTIMMTFSEFVAMKEGLVLPDRPTATGMSRINPFPTTDAHRKRIRSSPVKKAKPFAATVTHVSHVVSQRISPKLNTTR
jgi:hypothetical protein